jgi:hypothetical protein
MAVATNTRAVKRDATTAYVALNYTDGIRIYKTTNCGINWSLVSIQNSLSSHTPCGLCIIPSSPDIVLLMTEYGAYSYIYKSVDGGITFTQKLQVERNTLNYTMGNFLRFSSGRILAFLSSRWYGNNQGNLYGYTSDDNGNTWTLRVDVMGKTGWDIRSKILFMVEYSNGATCIATQKYISGETANDIWIIKTSDYGINWDVSALYGTTTTRPYTAVTQLANGKVVALTSTGTSTKADLCISSDLGATWTKKITNLARIDNMTSTKDRLIFYSSTDNKIYISDDEGTTITPVATVSGFINSFLLF